MCAPISKLPSNISTMSRLIISRRSALMQKYHHQEQGIPNFPNAGIRRGKGAKRDIKKIEVFSNKNEKFDVFD